MDLNTLHPSPSLGSFKIIARTAHANCQHQCHQHQANDEFVGSTPAPELQPPALAPTKKASPRIEIPQTLTELGEMGEVPCVHRHHKVVEVRPDYRLPRDVLPVSYHVTVEAYPDKKTFPGQVEVTAVNTKPTHEFELHSARMELNSASVTLGGKTYEAELSYDEETQRTKLSFEEELPPGTMTIRADYTGELRSDLHGVYLGDDGDEQAVVTQFQPADARSAFPSFDEPEFKAALSWTIITDPEYTVLANGPNTKSVERADGKIAHHFAPTKRPISTYLGAFTIGDYEATEPEMVDGIPCRVVAGKGKLEQTKFAQEVTRFMLPALKEYFDLPYPFQKLDQVAVPGFDAGAMENVGAIFYRPELLLVDENTPLSAKKFVAEVIGHENDHQYFGNLVSPEWWEDLWLNEAFATWHSKKLVDQMRPDWRIWDDFVVGGRARAMGADAMQSTHKIYNEVTNPHEATQNFSVITYRKGAAILRMAEQYVGEDRFRDGLRVYMREHANGNATSGDLWKALDGAAPEAQISRMMKSWVEQEGFPLVRTDLEQKDGRATLKLDQQRFHSDTELWGSTEQTWVVPMVIRYQDDEGVKTHRTILDTRNGEIELPAQGKIRWAYPNGGVTGFYRSAMNQEQLQGLLQDGLEHLSPAEKVNLLDDQWQLVKTGQGEMKGFTEALQAVAASDSDHLVLRSVAGHLSYLAKVVAGDEDKEALGQLTSQLLGPELENLKTDESESGREVRAILLGVLATVAKKPEALEEAKAIAQTEASDPTSVEPTLAQVALKVTASEGDFQDFESFTQVYAQRREQKAAPAAQLRYIRAMTAFQDPEAIDAALKAATGIEEGVPTYNDQAVSLPQDQMVSVLGGLLANSKAQGQAWSFIQNNWERIKEKTGDMSMSNLVESLGALDADKAEEVKEFFEKNPVPQASRSVEKALESSRLREALVTRTRPQLSQWLKSL